MGSAVGLAHGLPFVPPAEPGELFGAWMLRVAEAYGITMKRLFAHLGVPPLEREHHPHWFGLHAGSLSWSRLAVALHRPESALCAMAAPRYQSDWPLELGGCAHCLAQSRADGRALTWQQGWMHVSTVVCEQHRSWLTPVTLGELRTVRNERGLTELAQRVFDREKTPIAEIDGLIDSAVWLQRLMQEPQSFDPPWGAVRADVRQQMVNVVARMLVSENMRELVGSHGSDATHGGWSDDGGNWDMQTFSMEGHLGNAALLTLPRQLSTRQLLCGLIGNFLRYSPAERVMKSVRPSQLKLMIDKLPSSMGAWPLPAIAWISPKAAEFVRASRALRERHKISPAYFRAHAAMLQEFLASDSNM